MPKRYYRELDPEAKANADSPEDTLGDAIGMLEQLLERTGFFALPTEVRAEVESVLGLLRTLVK